MCLGPGQGLEPVYRYHWTLAVSGTRTGTGTSIQKPFTLAVSNTRTGTGISIQKPFTLAVSGMRTGTGTSIQKPFTLAVSNTRTGTGTNIQKPFTLAVSGTRTGTGTSIQKPFTLETVNPTPELYTSFLFKGQKYTETMVSHVLGTQVSKGSGEVTKGLGPLYFRVG